MEESGLDKRHRDKNGEIGKKHGNTLVSTLRKIYGPTFASAFPPHEKLSDVLSTLNDHSLTQLVKDHHVDTLHTKIKAAGG